MGKPSISCNSEAMGGTAVFAGTRVPVQTLLDYLEAGDSIDEFLAGFSGVSREQVIRFLEAGRGSRAQAAATLLTLRREPPRGAAEGAEDRPEKPPRTRRQKD